jgi:hypothetical protein
MSFYWHRFNLYLLATFLVVLATACTSTHHKKKEPVGILRVHIESEAANAGTTKTVQVLRNQPVDINITTDPILTEADVIAARVFATPGGFAVELRFGQTGGWTIEQFTAINPGKHFVIFGQWSDKVGDGRWLAAPIIVRRNATAMLAFTPDCTQAEAEQWVKGLNFAAKKAAGGKDNSESKDK